MKKLFYLLLILPYIIMFVSCDAEFDPNDDWKEQMLVYSLLDQDDDTTFVRIQKCFLGKGNAYEFAKIKDSIYYRPDELQVKMYACPIWDTNQIVDSFEFNYMTINKQAGDFYYSEDCPIYYCITKNKLNNDYYYKLVITNLKTNNKVKAGTYLVGDYTIKTSQLSPFRSIGSSTNVLNSSVKLEWYNIDATNVNPNVIGKQYQINIKFNYVKDGEIRSIEFPINKTVNTFSSSRLLDANITMADIVNGIEGQLVNESNINWYSTAPFEISISACNLAMYDYLSNTTASQNSLDYTPVYTNIDNGVGLFASRRLHINKEFADNYVDQKLRTQVLILKNKDGISIFR